MCFCKKKLLVWAIQLPGWLKAVLRSPKAMCRFGSTELHRGRGVGALVASSTFLFEKTFLEECLLE
ncbi:hypothetical protein A6X21_21765 [Planctopirus hydrillae]|uniref:Uncharacterized protein n=1 Tax=Planctopirus hydrillae TaxID=1841610 RepID=A0A1C3EFV7_9PLAN|nr:hypothetical protein A6X21_21765 [Planctopirus hydrillae]